MIWFKHVSAGASKDTAKLIFFENLFYMLDSDSNGLIAMEDRSRGRLHGWSRLPGQCGGDGLGNIMENPGKK